jgi:hypothetical protein
MTALESANRARTNIAEVKVELRAGALSAADALYDPRAASMTIERLLSAQPRWGQTRVHRTLTALRWATDGEFQTVIWPDMRVRDLTERQKRLLGGFLR